MTLRTCNLPNHGEMDLAGYVWTPGSCGGICSSQGSHSQEYGTGTGLLANEDVVLLAGGRESMKDMGIRSWKICSMTSGVAVLKQ